MKLLFDQNLPPRLVKSLADVYPGSEHVFNLSLDRASDRLRPLLARENEASLEPTSL